MANLTIEKLDQVYIRIYAEKSIQMELQERFTFDVPNAKYTPKFRNKCWDGKIRLFNRRYQTIYYGLLPYILKFCKENEYTVSFKDSFAGNEFSRVEALDFIKSLNIPSQFETRDYQVDTFCKAIREKRLLIISPTASGKSFMIYLMHRYLTQDKHSKTLIVVPTTTLVNQMIGDFVDYGYDRDLTYGIMAGVDKKIPADVRVVVTTWQSIVNQEPEWFQQFDLLVGDEAHTFKAKSLTEIMHKTTSIEYKFGTTGSLDGTLTHQMVLEGLFGPVHKVISTKELMDQGHVSKLDIKILSLKYSEQTKKATLKFDYQKEIDFLISNQERNNFIINLALSLKGNTLILYDRVDDHGIPLYEQIKSRHEETYLIHGQIETDERNEIRLLVDKSDGMIIVASYKTFATGISMKKLDNIIYASPFKSTVKNLQSIGRGLRKHSQKLKCTLFDIGDDLRHKTKTNHTYNHLMERIKRYNAEQFKFKIYDINLKEKV